MNEELALWVYVALFMLMSLFDDSQAKNGSQYSPPLSSIVGVSPATLASDWETSGATVVAIGMVSVGVVVARTVSDSVSQTNLHYISPGK